jgi:hypothetical protein
METYTDPFCGCRLLTTFTGIVRESLIEGEYRSKHLGSYVVTTGRWRASRRSK